MPIITAPTITLINVLDKASATKTRRERVNSDFTADRLRSDRALSNWTQNAVATAERLPKDADAPRLPSVCGAGPRADGFGLFCGRRARKLRDGVVREGLRFILY